MYVGQKFRLVRGIELGRGTDYLPPGIIGVIVEIDEDDAVNAAIMKLDRPRLLTNGLSDRLEILTTEAAAEWNGDDSMTIADWEEI